ncbi:type II toxin-antitoxin system HicB family antitoxin [Pediococcus ethanolidurans]|uniref:type II toxin-antitoxin system HicB family antitoxin n=1 Tax=Pediococcus ethanolidurans TaxID=319653 RepID=UPI0021E89844|nr:type II toxin-antitoxin system HicB family antitoxin [Pediococcus ethanolidurans]MCV3314991.1 type II toxin-antitoxin system HicB family antitoxin [Pediococcus ethanolidurans]MCV3322081.1 type II toxin-antitoxin system HicB family antitoxin [Pediococcus ethanolidurans]
MKIYPAIYSVQNGIVELLIPDFPGMLIEGKTLVEATEKAKKLIIAQGKLPEPSNMNNTHLVEGEHIIMLPITEYAGKNTKRIRRNVTIPQYLNDWAKQTGINVSQVLTEALDQKFKTAD